MNFKQLQELNEKFYADNKDKYEFVHTGFFNNNHVLLLGMNPGNPWSEDMKNLVNDMSQTSDYHAREKKYESIIKHTKITDYISRLFGANWNHLSFTNVVKCPTGDNNEPSNELTSEFLPFTQLQINLMNPNLVVCLGKWVGKQFGLFEFYDIKKIGNIFYMMIPHPSYYNYTGKSEDLISVVDSHLEEFFTLHGIIKVTNDVVYYRNARFQKKSYENFEDASQCFIKSDKPTIFKSFDGYYLRKIDRGFIEDKSKTYEEHLKRKDLFYYNNIKHIQHSKCIRAMHFDIENDFSNDVVNAPKEVISIGFFDSHNKEYRCFVYNKFNQQINESPEIIIYETEKSMLESFFELIKDYDVLTGWYSNGFDIPYLFSRARKLKIDLKKYFGNIFFEFENKEAKIFQDVVTLFDSLEFYKRTVYFNKPPSYSLDAVSKHLFGNDVSKLEKASNLPELWRTDMNRLIKYNLNDVMLLKMICEHHSILEYPLQLQQLCPQDFENAFYNSKTIENLLHHKLWKKNIFMPTKIEHEKPEFEGAVVFEPMTGLHTNVSAFDYSGMYTNIYLSWNFSPDTLVGEKNEVESKFDIIKNDLICRYPELVHNFDMTKEEVLKQWVLISNDFGQHYFLPKDWKLGILPEIEADMLVNRKTYTKLRDTYETEDPMYHMYDDLQGMAKTIINSIYGVTSYSKFVLFNPIISASITSCGRQLIEWVKKKAEEKNLKIIYGDTDSCFVGFDAKLSFQDVVQQTHELEKDIKSSFVDFMNKFTNNVITINTQSNTVECEKIYSKLMMSYISRDTKGKSVKKRYFGYLNFYKGKILDKEKLSIIGFDTRKYGTPAYFKGILTDVYECFLIDDYEARLKYMYKQMKIDIKNQAIDNLLMKIKLSRDIDKYIKTTPIHVRALKNSNADISRGEYVNMIFVKGDTEVMHYDETLDLKFFLDYDKYIEKFFVDKVHLIDDKLNFEYAQGLSAYFKKDLNSIKSV